MAINLNSRLNPWPLWFSFRLQLNFNFWFLNELNISPHMCLALCHSISYHSLIFLSLLLSTQTLTPNLIPLSPYVIPSIFFNFSSIFRRFHRSSVTSNQKTNLLVLLQHPPWKEASQKPNLREAMPSKFHLFYFYPIFSCFVLFICLRYVSCSEIYNKVII